MNKKTLAVLMLMGISLAAVAGEQQQSANGQANQQAPAPAVPDQPQTPNSYSSGNVYEDCKAVKGKTSDPEAQTKILECNVLIKLSKEQMEPVDRKASEIKSQDGSISCYQLDSFTIDYKGCEEAVAAYNWVLNTESVLDLTQQVRTQRNDQKLSEDTAKQVAQGESQGAVLDSAAKNNEFRKGVEKEKALAYSAAVAALVYAYQNIPVLDDAKKDCETTNNACLSTVEKYKGRIIANKNAKAGLVRAITTYTGKGIAAGIAMGNHDKAAQTLNKAKQAYTEEDSDLMMERCAFNPTDPLCIQPGNRVATSNYSGGGFTLGGDGAGNAFNLSPETVAPVEMGEETNLGGETVASVNSPFVDEAKDANEILNPAGAAQMQASGGAAGGGGGGGGGMGGGSASLGSDLAGAEAESNKEAQIKANKISGNYSSAGGGGYRGVAGGKEKANPFASLFGNKGAGGGIEEDKSVAADIDGASSGLFQKISNRYVKIQADKRIEASNLE